MTKKEQIRETKAIKILKNNFKNSTNNNNNQLICNAN